MHSSPKGTAWRRRSSARVSQVSLDPFERVPLMADRDDSPKVIHTSPLVQTRKNTSINDNDGVPILSKDVETTPKLRTWGDLIIVFLVLLLSETARGIVLPTLSPYVNLIGGNAVMLGYAVAAFSVGRFASTIGLGYLSTTLSYKKVLAGSVAICIVGNFMYSLAYFWGPYFLLASRFITGFGAGTLSVIRAYVAHVTTPQERTSYMSILGAVQFLGFAIMPGAGSLLSFIPRFYIAGASFDKFTMPGYVLAVGSFALFLLILFKFTNPPPLLKEVEQPKSAPPTPAPAPPSPVLPPLTSSQHVLYHPQSPHIHAPILVDTQFPPQPPFQPISPYHPPPYYIPPHVSPHFPPHSPASAILISPQFPVTPYPQSPQLGSPLLISSPYPPHSPQMKYHPEQTDIPAPAPKPTTPPTTKTEPTKKQKILIFGVFLVLNLMVRLVLGIIETIATPVYVALNDNKPGKDIEAGFVFGGLGLIGMGVLFLISYVSKFISDFKILVSGLGTLVLGTGLLIGHLNLPRFIIGCGFIWCIGYPLAQTIIVSMFSKMLGSKPQGTWMGWIGAMGSLGRIIGPVVAGFLLDRFGQSETMMFGTAIALISLLTSLLLLTVKTH